MRGKTKEIEKVFQTHGFSINSIIRDVMGSSISVPFVTQGRIFETAGAFRD